MASFFIFISFFFQCCQRNFKRSKSHLIWIFEEEGEDNLINH